MGQGIPPNELACYSPTVVSTPDGDYIIVIGGYYVDVWTATVKLFQVKTI